jgi:hypothetical protein
VPSVNVEQTIPEVGSLPSVDTSHVTALLGALLTQLVNDAGDTICPAAGMSTATCDQAYAVVTAISPCISPFLDDIAARSSAECGPLVNASINTLLRIYEEGLACALETNPVCHQAVETAGATTAALLDCVGVDVSPTASATRETVVTKSAAHADLWALCGEVVTTGNEVIGQAITAATECANGSNALCANAVATVVDAASQTLKCLDVDPGLTTGGTSLLAADLTGACKDALQTGRDTLAALKALVEDCANNPDGTCQQAIENASYTAGQIVTEAQDAGSQAARCLTGEGDATGQFVAACQEVQDRIAAVVGSLNGLHVGAPTDDESDVSDAEVRVANGDIDVEFTASLRIPFVTALDPTTLPEVEAATKTVSIMDDAGNVLSESRETVETAGNTVDGSCVLNGSELQKRALIAYPPTTTPREWSDDGIDAQYTTHVYQSNWARPVVGVGWTWQVEFCQVGGAEVYDAWRLNAVGSGVTQEDPNTTRIDKSWKSGKDLPTVEAELYAHVGSENAPVQIGGSTSQKANGVNGGSAGTRMPVKGFPEMDQFKHNTALARWDSVCNWATAYSACGSRDYQATVLHSLYEFPRSDPGPKYFDEGFYYKRRCTGFKRYTDSCDT